MTWETIDRYLKQVSAATSINRANLVLIRYGQDGKAGIVITAENCDSGYLKPDAGYSSKINLYQVQNAVTGTVIARWGLYEFPSCCAFCVSTQAFVDPSYRHKGVNKLSNTLRQDIARDLDYAALICTDIKTNTPERETLKANGFTDIYEIRNKRTRNDVVISVKAL